MPSVPSIPDEDVLVIEGPIAAEDTPPVVETRPGWEARLGWVWRPVLIFAASRLAVLVAAGVASQVVPGLGVAGALQKWDGAWFLNVIQNGYPTAVPMIDGHVAPSTICFFPLFPAAVRVVHWLGIGVVPAAFIVVTIAGLVAVLVLWRLLCAVRGPQSADRGVALVCFFPGALVFSMLYSEALMLGLTAGSLLALYRRWWITAGLLAALAGLTRFNGIVLVLPCAWAAFDAVRRRREWRALAAPALAPLGSLAFMVYLWIHTGVADAYFRTQREGWGQKIDPTGSLDAVSAFIRQPFGAVNITVVVAALLFIVAAGVAVVRARPPAVLVLYAVGCVAVSLLTPGLAFAPRFLVMAFPLVTAFADALPANGFTALVGAEAVLLGAWSVLVLSSTTVGP